MQHQQKSKVIGDAAVMKLKQARHFVRTSLLQALAQNDDTPLEAKKISAREAKTFRHYISERYLPFAFKTKRAAAWEDIIFRCHLLPRFGDVLLKDISKIRLTRL